MIVVPCGEHACSMVVKPSSCKAIYLGSGSGSHRKKAPCHVFPKKYGLRPGLWQWCPCMGRNRLSGAFSWPFKRCLHDVSPPGMNQSSRSRAHIFDHDWKYYRPHILKSSTSYLDYFICRTFRVTIVWNGQLAIYPCVAEFLWYQIICK